jgi:pimeloyl-ACP methyl ester carboxylesterase
MQLGRLAVLVALLCLAGSSANADQIVHKDGRQIEGRLSQLAGMQIGANAKAEKDNVPNQLIVVADDDLRRVFLSKRQVDQILTPPPEQVERFQLRQPVIHSRDRFGAVGQFLSVGPFDEFGRRLITMRGMKDDKIKVTQGITTMTPTWVKVEAVGTPGSGPGSRVQWEQRLSTRSIPTEQLDAILTQMIKTAPEKDHAHLRLSVVRFYLQAELIKLAEEKLKQLIADHPQQAAEFQPLTLRLRQMYAQQILKEIKARGDAGQFQMSLNLLDKFPTENVAGEVLQSVAKMQGDYRAQRERGVTLLKKFDDDLAKLADSKFRPMLKALREEMEQELSLNTLNRLAAFEQLIDDNTLTGEDRLSLAASGWMIGAAEAVRKLPQVASIYEVRKLVRVYLAEPILANRQPLADQIRNQEGGTPALVAKILAMMKPVVEPGEAVENEPGMYKIAVETTPGKPAGTYLVQLPPEYDPLRLYPTIVTLHGSASTPATQIDWWSGFRPEGSNIRLGQATRHGYIVIAPQWAQAHQPDYQFSAAEHGIVLNSLRDAMKRFSIDTDRVFLSGHSMGADAAWDIGIAHPDIWAGVIPIAAVGDRYVTHYHEHAGLLPWYFVAGELDGDRGNRNAVHFDRYFIRGNNVTLVEFQGRGHEHFSDEIQRLFYWMGRYRRQPSRREFVVRTMREFDNRFWCLDLNKFTEKSIVAPENWPPKGQIAARTDFRVTATNGIFVTTGAANVTVYLTPDLLDFDKAVNVTVNGSKLRTPGGFVKPDVAVMLEDVINRGDRLHPYWVRVDFPGGKLNLAGR